MAMLGDLCTIEKGKVGITKAIPGPYPLVVTAEERGSHNEYHFDRPSVVIPLVSSTGHGHASMKRIHYQEGKFAVGNILCAVTPNDENQLNANFLYHYLDVYKEELLVSRMKGMANVTLPIKELVKVEVPLMSIEEQNKWVELFKKTSINTGRLSSEINQQQKLLTKLRQSILQDAIQGKLTEKWREEAGNVEPASALLEKIKAEKLACADKRRQAGKIKKQKPLPPISPDEIPFDIPERWEWCRLGDVCSKIGSGSTPRGSNYSDNGIPFFRSQNIHNDRLDFTDIKYITPEINQKMNGTVVAARDLLLNITGGSLGRCALIPNDFKTANVSQHVCIIRPIILNPSLLHKVVLSRFFQSNIFSSTTGAGREGLPKNNLEQFIIPIIPLEEQKEIVVKVEKLFEYCDQLEKQMGKSGRESEHLMQSVLKEAFE